VGALRLRETRSKVLEDGVGGGRRVGGGGGGAAGGQRGRGRPAEGESPRCRAAV